MPALSELVTLRVNTACPAEPWWAEAKKQVRADRPEGARVYCPESCWSLITDGESVQVTRHEAGIFEAWAARIPGWRDRAGARPVAIEETGGAAGEEVEALPGIKDSMADDVGLLGDE